MRSRPDERLLEEFSRFQESVRTLAVGIIDSLIRQELQHRLDALRLDAPKASRRSRVSRSRPAEAKPPQTPEQISQAEIREVLANNGRRRLWTRDTIVNELVGWLVSGTTIDAAFVTRHGPPGLVSATRKIFGRFDAALNVAGLEVAKRYPDGAPSRRTT